MNPVMILFFVSITLLSAGCISPVDQDGYLKHKDITVSLSDLDWIEIAYFPDTETSDIQDPCRLSFFGTGQVEFRIGRSPQIWSDFATNFDHPDWNDITVDRMHLSKSEMTDVFQTFIDNGLIPSDMARFTKSAELTTPYIKVLGSIGFEKFKRVTDNKYLVELTEDALSNFESIYKQRN